MAKSKAEPYNKRDTLANLSPKPCCKKRKKTSRPLSPPPLPAKNAFRRRFAVSYVLLCFSFHKYCL